MTEETKPARPKGLALLRAALATRKAGAMLAFGFSSGLPYALLLGTVSVWLDDLKIDLKTIGVLSWVGLCYSFKFLWSPGVDRLRLPVLGRLGRRKSWILLCQLTIIPALLGLALTNPAHALGQFALFALLAALASATQDVAVDAWRIDVADAETPVELLSAIYQFGYRTASIVGGAFALVLAARMPWGSVFAIMAGLMLVVALITARAPDAPRPPADPLNAELSQPGAVLPGIRAAALTLVGLSWLWAVTRIGRFMSSVLGQLPPGVKPPSAVEFTRSNGAWIVAATVLVPLGVATLMNGLQARGAHVLQAPDPVRSPARLAMNHLYGARIAPLAELVARLRLGVLVVIGMILSYQLVFSIWATFALPFYQKIGYSKDEIAFASKLFGIVMTMLGVSVAGYLFARIGRLKTLLVGAVVPIFGTLIYADLASGGAHLDTVGNALGLGALAHGLGYDPKLTRLLMAIVYENIATGIAGASFVAYVSGIVSRRYTAVQYALLSSLTFLIGSLARGLAGEWFDIYGYAPVFRGTAVVGLISVGFVLLEWVRVARNPQVEG